MFRAFNWLIYAAYYIYRFPFSNLDYHIFLQWAASSLKCLNLH